MTKKHTATPDTETTPEAETPADWVAAHHLDVSGTIIEPGGDCSDLDEKTLAEFVACGAVRWSRHG